METKKDYEDAIKKIREAFYSSICDEWALEQIAVNLDFLSSLINEHFKEKTETNYEHFKDEIIENSGYCFALADGKLCQCSDISCSECGFSTGHGCSEKIKEWLNKPYEKPIYQLTQFECDLIQTYSDFHESWKLSEFKQLMELKDKGYFKCIDDNTSIQDVLKNCEVIK